MRQEIRDYIGKRYDNWLTFTDYHCATSGLGLEPADVLNDVLCDFIQRDTNLLMEMLPADGEGPAEFDFLIMGIVRRNITSPRSKYRYVKGGAITCRTDLTRLQIAEEAPDNRYAIVMETAREVGLSPLEREVFDWRFDACMPFTLWPGPESGKKLSKLYCRASKKIAGRVREKLAAGSI